MELESDAESLGHRDGEHWEFAAESEGSIELGSPPATMSRVIAMIAMGHQTAMSRDTTINSCEKEEGVVSN